MLNIQFTHANVCMHRINDYSSAQSHFRHGTILICWEIIEMSEITGNEKNTNLIVTKNERPNCARE